ncbi:ABC transporter ATP-binding protein [Clostridium sp. UBA4548]|uniref:ABC transporter ATP-binding protein n=1 Tax=Clostridium sp. UBA4548 TaxID=1946361 RepID=UPI0025BB6F19|nr:ABC transporter ATP-binding protein [Clostridium sp. UBA4548]
MDMFKVMKKYLKKYRVYILIFIILNCITWITSIIIPYLLGNYVDQLIVSMSKDIVLKFAKQIVVLSILDIVISYFRNINMVRIKSKVSFDLIFDTIEHVKRLPLTYFRNNDPAYINQKINIDSNTVTNFVIENFITIVFRIFTIITLLFLILKLNIKMFVLILVIIPLSITNYFLFRKPLYNSGYEFQETQSKFFAKINQQLYIIKLIKINSWFAPLAETVKKCYNLVYVRALNYAKQVNKFNNSNSSIRYLATISLILFGGFEIVNERLTIGEFTILNSYFSMVLECINYFLNFSKSYQDTLVSYSRLKDIRDQDEEHNGQQLINEIDVLEINNVSFSYEKGKKVIEDFSYTFKKGKIYCLLGNNGTGKTTLIDIIAGLRYDYRGDIYINNLEIKKVDMYSVRKNLIGVVEQEPVLLKDSLRNNLTFAIDEYSEEMLNYYCEKFGIYSLIDDEERDEGESANTSGGEKQKISLIRTLLKDPDLIILDEPSSALDKQSIVVLNNILNNLKLNKIIIIITHNKEVIDFADEIISLS